MIGPASPAPYVELPDQDGEPVRLSAGRGRVMVEHQPLGCSDARVRVGD
jgi:hypothetical protein